MTRFPKTSSGASTELLTVCAIALSCLKSHMIFFSLANLSKKGDGINLTQLLESFHKKAWAQLSSVH